MDSFPFGWVKENWRGLAALAGGLVALGAGLAALDSGESEPRKAEWRQELPEDASRANATFAGGCFWCTEAVFEQQEGVARAISGYAGGARENASYSKVSTGETEHREAVRIVYYPERASYTKLLELYWRSIDPTDDGGQFVDRGRQYTTAIYAHTDRQYRLALESRRNLSESGKFEEPIVTEVKNLTTFFPAEDRHQNYSRRRTARYEIYKQGSGREGFIDRYWEQSPF